MPLHKICFGMEHIENGGTQNKTLVISYSKEKRKELEKKKKLLT